MPVIITEYTNVKQDAEMIAFDDHITILVSSPHDQPASFSGDAFSVVKMIAQHYSRNQFAGADRFEDLDQGIESPSDMLSIINGANVDRIHMVMMK